MKKTNFQRFFTMTATGHELLGDNKPGSAKHVARTTPAAGPKATGLSRFLARTVAVDPATQETVGLDGSQALPVGEKTGLPVTCRLVI